MDTRYGSTRGLSRQDAHSGRGNTVVIDILDISLAAPFGSIRLPDLRTTAVRTLKNALLSPFPGKYGKQHQEQKKNDSRSDYSKNKP